jgi:hypothetical protein
VASVLFRTKRFSIVCCRGFNIHVSRPAAPSERKALRGRDGSLGTTGSKRIARLPDQSQVGKDTSERSGCHIASLCETTDFRFMDPSPDTVNIDSQDHEI